MQLGLDLALAGHPPILCPQALVRGSLPSAAKVALTSAAAVGNMAICKLFSPKPRVSSLPVSSSSYDWTYSLSPPIFAFPPLSLLLGFWFFFHRFGLLIATDGFVVDTCSGPFIRRSRDVVIPYCSMV